MRVSEVRLPQPSFVEEFILRSLGCHMPDGTRRVRVEYGFECGCPEGTLYFPPGVTLEQMDAVEDLLVDIWGSVISIKEIE